ncbi:hypothetical protein F5B20DRAFT_580546 [Whalleya microplaca]|nr:hypothetical protein F5B20DRAFT_580546 [Whalleya microplaca]
MGGPYHQSTSHNASVYGARHATSLKNHHSTTPAPVITDYRAVQQEYPTKIQALIHDVLKLPISTQSIVFSFWKSTLDITNTALAEAGISCAQVDGTVKPIDREDIFQEFQTGKNIRVLLLSLSCGAVGLTLTAASRAYLMEPQWNPSIEEQALTRIHRIGQTKEVTTIRFVMDDSIEKYVTDIQGKKTDLISVLLSSSSKVSKQRLRELREWLQ